MHAATETSTGGYGARPRAPARQTKPRQAAPVQDVQDAAPVEAQSDEQAEDGSTVVRIEGNDSGAVLAAMTNEAVAQLMIDFREKAADLTARYNKRLKELETMQDEIERHIAQRVRTKRIPKSVKVPQPDGSVKTISLSIDTKVMPSVSDRKAFFSWVRQTGNFQIVQARVSTKEVEALSIKLRDLYLAGKITEDQTVVPGMSVYRKEVLAASIRTTQAG